jgi:hypothetical protein
MILLDRYDFLSRRFRTPKNLFLSKLSEVFEKGYGGKLFSKSFPPYNLKPAYFGNKGFNALNCG